ncbi:MAG TPA: alcohol dehydrogenase catalytic domain-containing protein [Oscillatoriaceae cyanobacterium]
MKAIRYEVNLGTYVLGKAVGKQLPGLYYGPLSGLRYGELDAPQRRGEDWAIVEVTHAGVCGSDMAAILYKSSPALTPFTSFPSVLGHEVVGRVAEVGHDVHDFRPGDRVVVEPFLTCASRGMAVACEACREGHYCVCHHVAEGPMAPGLLMGACRDQGGAWAERLSCHRSQLFKLPDTLSDRQGVLVEPLSIGVHAVLRRVPEPGAKVLVIGSGMMAYAAIAALRWLAPEARITQMTHLPYQRDAGLALGAHDSICVGAGDEPDARVVAITGAKRYKPILGRQVFTGGFDQIYDCVGSAESLQDAFTYAKARATIVLVGAPGELGGLDWTFVWARELTLLGTVGYGVESWRGERIRTFDLTMRLLQESPLPVEALVTHEFPLSRYAEAIEANLDRARSQALKTVFTPGRTV